MKELYEALLAHEKWEADIIVNGYWGPDGMASTPTLTQKQMDDLTEVQNKRNSAIQKYLKEECRKDSIYALAKEYHDRCDDFDSVNNCGNSFKGGLYPPSEELIASFNLSCGNVALVAKDIFRRAALLQITPTEMNDAIRNYREGKYS